MPKAGNASVAVVDPNPHRRTRTSAPAVVHSGRPIHTSGKLAGLQFVDQVRELGIDDPTKLLAAARRTREHIATHVQEPRSTNLPHVPGSTESPRRELACLRAEEVRPQGSAVVGPDVPVAQRATRPSRTRTATRRPTRPPNSPHRSAPTPKPPTADLQAAEATPRTPSCAPDCPIRRCFGERRTAVMAVSEPALLRADRFRSRRSR